MNLFSRIGAAAKYAATGRLSMSALSGGFEGAMAKRRLIAWKATEQNINGLVSSGGDLLRARARQIVRSNPYASNAANSFVSNAIGDGIRPSCLIEDDVLKDDIVQLWKDWVLEVDADGLTDFFGMQALIAHALFEAGECFIRFRPRRDSDGLSVPLQLQLLESEMLPLSKTEQGTRGNSIRCGIEFNGIGKRVAYHFYRKHPGDSTESGNKGESVRVPASEVLHIYRPQRPGQIRGVPWIAPALVKLFLLDQYDDAELDRKKVAALFAGFITKDSPEDKLIGESDADENGSAIAGLSPGTMQVLLPGEDIKFSSPADVGGSYEVFQYRTLLAISAALGVPYANVTGDLKSANYSSTRAGTVEFRRRLNQFQEMTMIFQLCRPVWQRWLSHNKPEGAHGESFALLLRLQERKDKMGMLSKIVWFTKFRHKGKSNALGLIAGAATYFAGQGLNAYLGLDPLAFETFLGGLALLVAVGVTKLFRVLVKRFPFLQKIEGSAEELLDKVPEIETPTNETCSTSKGPENGNYNK